MTASPDHQALWASDGARYERVEAEAGQNGDLVVRRHEMGGGDRAAWGEDDDEVTLEIPPRAVARLALALIEARFGGRRTAFAELRDFCEAHDIPTRHARWT